MWWLPEKEGDLPHMVHTRAPDHTPIAIKDTTMLRSHIAILKIKYTHSKGHRLLRA
jgi:hypothetical protein